MAKLKNPVLGNVSGTVGNIVFTEKGDSSFLFRKTQRVKYDSPTMDQIRGKFRLLSLIATGINKTDELKKLWPANKKLRITRFNSIFQTNYQLVNSMDDLGSMIMAPGYGFPITNGVITPTLTGITFASDGPGVDSGVDPNLEKFIMGAGIVVLRSPINESSPAIKVLRLTTGKQSLEEDAPISLVNNYNGDELTEFQAYTIKKIYMILVTTTSNGVVVHRSVQFSH